MSLVRVYGMYWYLFEIPIQNVALLMYLIIFEAVFDPRFVGRKIKKEGRILKNTNSFKERIILWRRYVNDIFCNWKGNVESIDKFN